MPRNEQAATVSLWMAPQLKAALKDAAADAGCSLNAYLVQLLGAAVGDASRFRVVAPGPPKPSIDDERTALRALERRADGYPEGRRDRNRHSGARAQYADEILQSLGHGEASRVMFRIDRDCPWHYVEWAEFNAPLAPEGPGFEDLRAAG